MLKDLKTRLDKIVVDYEPEPMEKEAFWGAFLSGLAAMFAGDKLLTKSPKLPPRPEGDTGFKDSTFGEAGPRLSSLAIPASVGAGGLLLYKILKDKEDERKLRFPKKINVDVPMAKISEDGVSAISLSRLMDSPMDALPWFVGGAIAPPLIHKIFKTLGESRKDKEYKELQQKLDQLRTVSLPYPQQVEKMSSDIPGEILDTIYEEFEKNAGILDDVKNMASDFGNFVGNKGVPVAGGLLGLLLGSGFVAGDIGGKHFTYDPTLEKMKLEEEYGDILRRIKKIPININPIDAEKNKLEELKNRKKRRVLPRSSDTIDKDININDFLD